MRTWAYPAVFDEHGPSDVVVTFPDIAEAITGGVSMDEARVQAVDVLEEAVLVRLSRGEPVPLPRSAQAGEELVILDPVTAARAALAHVMADRKISNVALAARLGRTEGAVRQLTSGQAGVKLDTVLQALSALEVRGAFATI